MAANTKNSKSRSRGGAKTRKQTLQDERMERLVARQERDAAREQIREAKRKLRQARIMAGHGSTPRNIAVALSCFILLGMGALFGWYFTEQSYSTASGQAVKLAQAEAKIDSLQVKLDEANARLEAAGQDTLASDDEQDESTTEDSVSDTQDSSSADSSVSSQSFPKTYTLSLVNTIGGSFGACWGAQDKPLVITINSISGVVINADIKALYHGHRSDNLSSDVAESTDDEYLEQQNLNSAGKKKNRYFILTSAETGNYAIVRVRFKDGNIKKADVESYYGSASDPVAIDSYSS